MAQLQESVPPPVKAEALLAKMLKELAVNELTALGNRDSSDLDMMLKELTVDELTAVGNRDSTDLVRLSVQTADLSYYEDLYGLPKKILTS
ncbi:hypothetical protein LINGRAHAP2_LOCUS23891 [Linum grandiflorum]